MRKNRELAWLAIIVIGVAVASHRFVHDEAPGDMTRVRRTETRSPSPGLQRRQTAVTRPTWPRVHLEPFPQSPACEGVEESLRVIERINREQLTNPDIREAVARWEIDTCLQRCPKEDQTQLTVLVRPCYLVDRMQDLSSPDAFAEWTLILIIDKITVSSPLGKVTASGTVDCRPTTWRLAYREGTWQVKEAIRGR